MKISSEIELAATIASGKGPFRIVGGGTRLPGRPADAAELDLSGLTGIRLYEPDALTLVAAAGTPLAEVEDVLAAKGQRLAFEPSDWRGLLGTTGHPTLGGMVAANISGPRRVQAGACRDALLGVRFVDGTGAIVKNGGRVMKNVTGYDLVKLMAGSWGTLGVIAEVALKVLPAPQAVASLTLTGLDDASAVRAMAAALGSPYEVTAAVHHRGRDGAQGKTRFRLEGLAGSVAYRMGALVRLLAPFGAGQAADDAGAEAALWRGIRDLDVFCGVKGDVWRLSVKASDSPDLVKRSGALDAVYDWGGGLVWLLTPEGTDLRACLGSFQGHATLIRASSDTRSRIAMFQPQPALLAAIAAGLRSRFDPKGILNPGLMG